MAYWPFNNHVIIYMQAEEVYLWNVFTAEGYTNAKREHNTWPVGETY